MTILFVKKGDSGMAKKMRHRLKLSPTQIIALTFAAIIFVGALLLTLPISSRSGKTQGFLTALFTSTSATCVTGLVMGDTWSMWSGFGQVVIITLIEIGGLGFMSAASLFIFLLRKKIGLRQRMLIAQALSVNEMDGVVRLQKWVLLGSLVIQLSGAAILFCRFITEFSFGTALKWSLFHAVSAFCNAGFDIFGEIAPNGSIITFNNDPVICLTLMALVVIGCLGFFVWEDVATKRKFKKFSIYTKLVLLTTGGLLLLGTVLFAALEWNNPQTLGTMPAWQRLLNAGFQSVTVRTAGFAGVDQALLTDGSKAVSIFLMLIGGSSGSTAGGIKTITMLVLVLFMTSRARGKNRVHVFGRNVPQEKVMDAITIISLVVGLAFFGAVFISATNPVTFADAFFETASAIATVGLTAGLTPTLNVASKLLLIVFMYFGRVGVLTISLGFLMGDKADDRIRYADTNLLIG